MKFPTLAGLAGALLMLVACGGGKSTNNAAADAPATNAGAVQFYGAKVSATIADLPTCDKTTVGQLFYILSNSTFQFCATDGYQVIALSGKDGANGVNGTSGTNGSSCAVADNADATKTIKCTDGTTATVQNGNSCTVKDNGDNSYDLGCGGTTITVRDGTNGTNGANGKDGTNGLDGTGAPVHVPDLLLWSANDSEVTTNDVVTFTVSLVTDAAGTSDIKHYRWDFNGDGTWDKDNATANKETHQYTTAGTYKAYLKITDSQGASDIDSIEIHVFEGTVVDARDGQSYRTSVIGGKLWMAQNLNYSGGKVAGVRTYTKGWCYGVGSTPSAIADTSMHQDSASCDSSYGRLYRWTDAMNIAYSFLTTTAKNVAGGVSSTANNQGLCPANWHVPSTMEWNALASYIRMNQDRTTGSEGIYLKAVITGNTSWNTDSYNAQDPYGFSAVPAGVRGNYTGGWSYRGDVANFWSASEIEASFAYGRTLSSSYADLNASYGYNKADGNSLRCTRD